MAIGMLTMLTPLEERIDRWATSGKAKQILLHPEDFIKVKKKQDAIEAKYGMPITVLGGNRALNDFLRNTDEIEKEDREVILADLNDVFQSEE